VRAVPPSYPSPAFLIASGLTAAIVIRALARLIRRWRRREHRVDEQEPTCQHHRRPRGSGARRISSALAVCRIDKGRKMPSMAANWRQARARRSWVRSRGRRWPRSRWTRPPSTG